jgi:hypothetical protein
MALSDRVSAAARVLLGIAPVNAYTPDPQYQIDLDDPAIEHARSIQGGYLQPPSITRNEWLPADLAHAQQLLDMGDVRLAAQLSRAMRRDGYIVGLEKTRSSGLIALPKIWRGRKDIVDALTAENGSRTVFDEMFPPTELSRLVADRIKLGVGVAEMVPVVGRDHPVMVRLEPEFLHYRQSEGRWYYRSTVGALPIMPGNGRWILHTSGMLSPWNDGIWAALGRAFINKEHALLGRGNFAGKLANPARVAYAPNGATEEQRLGFLQKLIRWGFNSVFALPVGWEVKLLESNGRGWEVFKEEIDHDDLEIMIALVGQIVTVTGGAGFSNADIHRTVRADLIKEDGDALSYTLSTQGLPPYVYARFGADALQESARVAWDTNPPQDREAEARALMGVGAAIVTAGEALGRADVALDVDEVVRRFRVPTKKGAPAMKPKEPEKPANKGSTDV